MHILERKKKKKTSVLIRIAFGKDKVPETTP